MRDVVVGRPAVVLRIVDVGQRHIAVVVGIEVDGLAVGIRVQHREVVREPALELDQQGVVVERAFALHLANRPKCRRNPRVWTIDVRVSHPDDRRGLVRVAFVKHLPALRPDVRHLQHVVREEGPLNVEVPLTRVRVAEIDIKDGSRVASRRPTGIDPRR